MANYKKVGMSLMALMLLISFLHIQGIDAARTPNLTIVKISPYNEHSFAKYHKYVPGYAVEVANFGSAVSKPTTLDMYIRTYDGKSLKKSFPIPAINAGKIIRVKFSMNAGTDGSLKDGYAIINPKKSFKEISYKDNIKKFGLKDVMIKNSYRIVTETYRSQTPQNQIFVANTSSYNSPMSSGNNITKIECNVLDEYMNRHYIVNETWRIPGYLHNNVTLTIYNNYYGLVTAYNFNPAGWNDTHIWFNIDQEFRNYEGSKITITGENLESKNTVKESISILESWNGYYINIADEKTREIKEYYYGYTYHTSTYTITDSKYTVHNPNVVSLKVTGDPRGFYCAGWFINPSATSINSVTALYGTNKKSASYISGGTWGVSQKIRDINSIGFEINGTNIKGFTGFKTLGFNSWTWRELY